MAEYLIDLNGAAAVLRAGYRQTSASAKVTASRLLTKANVRAAVADGQRKGLEAAQVSASRVLDELAQVAFANVSGLFGADWSLRPVAEWPEDLRKAVSSVDTTSGSVVRVRFHDKLAALNLLARHLGLLSTQPVGQEIVIRWAE